MRVLDEDLIHIGVDVSTADQAIEYISDILYKKGYVKEGYAQRVIEREKQYPTGLIGKGIGIAIPHTTSDYAVKPAVCVLIPKQPIPFMMMGTTDEEIKAQVLMPMVVKDNKMQLSMLRKMMALLKDTERLEKIRQATDKQEILQLLSCLEEE